MTNNKNDLSLIKQKAQKWLTEEYDEKTQKAVQEMLNDPDPKNLIDSFYQDLKFGTGGLRGIMGVGSNRINIYTIANITQGIGNYALQKNDKNKIVIAYDCRLNNDVFSRTVAEIFAKNSFEVFLFANPRPTPLLSFAIRYLKCQFGIVLTASHNPPKYNGYKVYGSDGGQIVAPEDELIVKEISKVTENVLSKNISEEQKKKIKIIHKEVENAYLETLKKEYTFLSSEKSFEKKKTKIVYTALHGTGITLIPKILNEFGFEKVILEKQQAIMDGNFPTVSSPNPEEKKSLSNGVELLEKQQADILLATDPDTDRIGVVGRNKDGSIYYFNGNEIAALIFHYILNLSKEDITQKDFCITTVVTSPLLKKIASYFKVEIFELLTGFKYIAEWIEKEKQRNFVLGAEESYGYLYKDFVRDKDAVSASLLISTMAEYYLEKGFSLYDVLIQIYNQYGFHYDKLFSYTLEGKQGQEEIQGAIVKLKEEKIIELFTKQQIIIKEKKDYAIQKSFDFENKKESSILLPKSNLLQFFLEDGTRISIRPSGTEPKLKMYINISENKTDKQIDKSNIQQKIKSCREKCFFLEEKILCYLGLEKLLKK